MTGCVTCNDIMNGKTTGVKCMLLRYRKYIIGAVIGASIMFAVMKTKKIRR